MKLNTQAISAVGLFTILIGCSTPDIDTVVPQVTDTDKTMTVKLSSIPAGQGGASTYIFTTQRDKNFAIAPAKAVEGSVVKVMPGQAPASFDIVAFIPSDGEWTPDDGFNKGYYSRMTGISDPKAAFVTKTWTLANDLAGAPASGVMSAIDAVLKINGSATPSNTDFSKGDIVTLDATVTDNVQAGITTVAYLLDKTELKSYTTSPYSFDFNTLNTELGNHTVYVKATNGVGNVTMDSVRIFISQTGNKGPSIAFNGLSNNDEFERQTVIQIDAIASDPDDGLDKVELKINNTLVGTDKTAPYSFVWDTYSNAVGTVTLELIATDKSGQARSAVINVKLTAPTNYAPRVTFTAPADGAQVTAGSTVSIAVNVADPENNAITQVDFSYRLVTDVFETALTSDNTAPYTADFDTTGLTPGDYVIFAQASDATGSSYSSRIITIK